MEVYNGIICNNSVQVRRIAFSGYSPDHFYRIAMKVAQYDDDIISALTEEEFEAWKYDDDKEYFSNMEFKAISKPSNGWAVPYVTGHKYRIHWGETPLDFTKMMFEQSEQWESTDSPIHFVSNFTDVREAIEFKDGAGEQIMNQTYTGANSGLFDLKTGMNDVWNDTETREF